MKIVQISPYPPAVDGIGSYTGTLVAALRGAGHDVRVAAARSVSPASPEVLGAVGIAHLPQRIKRFDPDVIHVQFAVAAFGTRTLALLRLVKSLRPLRARLVVTMHEITRDTATLGLPGRALYRWLARQVDEVVVHTAAAHHRLVDLVGATVPSRVIPHPAARPPEADTTPAQLRRRFELGTDRVLLAFGFIHVDKGLGDLVNALAELSTVDGVRLVVAGRVRPRSGVFRLCELRDHVHFARVRRTVRRAGLHGNVVYTGYVPENDVAGWFVLADALVLPYRRIEHSGVASLAEAFGTPVLASSVGGLAEQFADCRWQFPPRRPDRLALVLTDFLHSQRHSAPARPGVDLGSVVERTVILYAR